MRVRVGVRVRVRVRIRARVTCEQAEWLADGHAMKGALQPKRLSW